MEREDRPQRNRKPRRKVCQFCVDKVEFIDYKDVAKLRRVPRFFPEESPVPAQSTRESLL